MNNDEGDSFRGGARIGWLLGGLVLLVVFAFAIALAVRYVFRTTTMPHLMGGYFPILFFPFGFLFFFLMIFVIARLAFWPWGWGYRRAHWHHRNEAGEIVKARYAKGDITKEQFDQMMRDLEQHS